MNNNKIIKKEEEKNVQPLLEFQNRRENGAEKILEEIITKFDRQVYTLYQQTPNKINMKKSLHWDIISNYEKPKNKEKI